MCQMVNGVSGIFCKDCFGNTNHRRMNAVFNFSWTKQFGLEHLKYVRVCAVKAVNFFKVWPVDPHLLFIMKQTVNITCWCWMFVTGKVTRLYELHFKDQMFCMSRFIPWQVCLIIQEHRQSIWLISHFHRKAFLCLSLTLNIPTKGKEHFCLLNSTLHLMYVDACFQR